MNVSRIITECTRRTEQITTTRVSVPRPRISDSHHISLIKSGSDSLLDPDRPSEIDQEFDVFDLQYDFF